MGNHGFRADDRLNQINDRDEMWGPLLFLRPERHQPMTPNRVLAISGLLGTFYGMLGNVVIALLARDGVGYKPHALAMPALLTAMYFIAGQLSLVGAWNRRARLMSRRLDWSELTGRALSQPRDDHETAE
jgi:hypothetical protein